MSDLSADLRPQSPDLKSQGGRGGGGRKDVQRNFALCVLQDHHLKVNTKFYEIIEMLSFILFFSCVLCWDLE